MRLSSTGQTSFNIMRGIMRTLAGWQRRRTRPAARGSSSHNPHYVWRPRVQPRSPCSAKLRWRSALLSAVVPFCGPAVTAIPGGSGAVLRRRHRVAVSQKRLSAWRPPLKRTLCPPGVVWLRRLVPRKKAARHSFPPRQLPLPAPVRHGHAKASSGQAAVPQSAVPSLADSLPPAPADPAPWPRHAAGGGLAAPSHGVPETDLVESGMTRSWWW